MARAGVRWAGAALVAFSAMTVACSREEAKPAPTPPAPPPAAPPPVAPPAALGRAELLEAVAKAASAFAAGDPHSEAAKALAGRQFTLKLPFACGRLAPEDAGTGYAYDAEAKTLRIRARPEDWTKADWAAELVGSEDTEAIEGFWVRRPWLVAESCPAWSASAPPTPASAETVGLAQVFEKGGSRLLRRGDRGYAATVKREVEDVPGPSGLRLVLEGRIGPGDVGGPVRCRSASPNQRPTCLVLVEFDRIAFEDARGAVLSEWRS